MSNLHPRTETYFAPVGAVAAGSDLETPIFVMPFDGVITAVTYIPRSTLTGANTDSRTAKVFNRDDDGTGTTLAATLAFTSGINATGLDEKAITLSATAADLVVTEGQVISWQSLHVGSTGLADPGGMVKIIVSRS